MPKKKSSSPEILVIYSQTRNKNYALLAGHKHAMEMEINTY